MFGALAGGLILGIIENLAAYYLGIGWIDAVSYGVFMLVLIFLPQGLFGRRGAGEEGLMREASRKDRWCPA